MTEEELAKELDTEFLKAVEDDDRINEAGNDMAALLTERGSTHGRFIDHARATQRIKLVIRDELRRRNQRGQDKLTDMHIEALEMIAHKIGRILAGDPDFADHWIDISGYAELPGRFKEL